LNNNNIDNNSIFPIIINIIIETFEIVNKLLKKRLSKSKRPEVVVLVRVKIDNLKAFSKVILSKSNNVDKIKRLIKKEIKIKKDILIISLLILVFEKGIFFSIT
tara:strand:+ start:326 stop:637 length:312 start_codon:yes stop_codon:yes gene_type:complete